MKGLSSIVALVFIVLLLVVGSALLITYSIGYATISEKIQERQAAISTTNQDYLRIDSLSYDSGTLHITFTALRGPVDLNDIDVFVNHIYLGGCGDLNCEDQTGNGILIEGESGEVNIPIGSSCSYTAKLDYRGSSTEKTMRLDNCWSCHRVVTVTSTYDYNNYPVRIELNTSNFDLSSTNGSDLRFYDSGRKLDYWIEDWTDERAIVWVEVNVIAGNKNIDMYYCNPDAKPESNGYAVFDWFDFDDTNLVAVFRFDEGSGTNTYSSVGSYTGTLHGATWTSGYFGPAIQFDGNDDYVDTNFDVDANTFTYIFRLKPEYNQPDTIGKPVSDGAWNRSVGVYRDSYPNIKFYVQYDTGGTACYSNPHVPGQWYSIVARVGGSTEDIYVNGSQENTCAISGIPSRVTDMILGIESTASMAYDYNGILDDLIIFARSLDNAEISALSEGYLDHLSTVWVVRKRVDPEPIVTIGSKETGSWILT